MFRIFYLLIGSGLCWLLDEIGICVIILFCVFSNCRVELDLLMIILVVFGSGDGVIFGIWMWLFVLFRFMFGLSCFNSLGDVWKCLFSDFLMLLKFSDFSLVCVVGFFGIVWNGLVIFLLVSVQLVRGGIVLVCRVFQVVLFSLLVMVRLCVVWKFVIVCCWLLFILLLIWLGEKFV